MRKKGKVEEEKPHVVNDSACEYQRKFTPDGVTRFISQEELDRDCMTAEKSKRLLLEKINRHYHCS